MASYKTVLDVSKYQTVTSWSNVAKDVDGVIIRAGYRGYGSSGTLTKDPKFTSFIKGASEAGIPLTVYFFSQAITEAEAKAEADYTISLIGDYEISMPIYIDIEYANSSKTGRADSLGKSARTAVAVAFCKEIEAKGYKGGVYSSDSWFNSMLDQSKLKDYSLWVARYSTSAPKYVSSYDAWQYTSSGTVSGVSGKVDLSKWYAEISTSAAKASSSSSSTTESATATTTSSTTSTTTSAKFATGDKVTLSSTKLYGTSATSTVAATKSGTYYIWSNATINNRIRITDSSANVGKAGKITGWVEESAISKTSTTTSSSSSTTTTTTNTSSSSSTSYQAGTKITLKNANIYASASSTKASNTVTGTYYLWNGEVSNGKIRITNSKANVGKAGQVTGWISTSLISGTSSTSSSSSKTYTAGTKVSLKKVNLYTAASSTKASTTVTGTYYLWDGTVTNGRIRITNKKANAGKSGQITGWISTSVI